MHRSIQWARGNILNVPDADGILSDLRELIEEVRRNGQEGGQGDIIV